jgi:hypothetical protein
MTLKYQPSTSHFINGVYVEMGPVESPYWDIKNGS